MLKAAALLSVPVTLFAGYFLITNSEIVSSTAVAFFGMMTVFSVALLANAVSD